MLTPTLVLGILVGVMRTYKVRIPEVHYGYCYTDAHTPQDAISNCIDGNADEDPESTLEYGYTLGPEDEPWIAEEV